MSKVKSEDSTIPPEFLKVMKDFLTDMIATFPEYEESLKKLAVDIVENEKNEEPSKDIVNLFNHCKETYTPRFFDLLYQNNEIYKSDQAINFLPGIDFRDVWKQDITEKTRLIIWKYLQLVCFSIVNSENNSDSFGDTANLFEAINEEELKSKLEETMEQMSKIFDMSGNAFANTDGEAGMNMEDMPNPDELHEHISGLLDGKLGRLASEITEETMKDFQDISGVNSVTDIFQVLFKDPGRLMKMIKKVGGNLDEKIKSGEIKESELMEEASELMKKLHKMPGMENMQKMMSQMGMPTGGKNSKVNMGAFQGQMQRNISKAKTKERLRRKLEKKKKNAQDEQIKILEAQLAAVRAENANLSNPNTNNVVGAPTENKKKKKKKRKRKKNKTNLVDNDQ
jgi:hypothetical protein